MFDTDQQMDQNLIKIKNESSGDVVMLRMFFWDCEQQKRSASWIFWTITNLKIVLLNE